MELSTILDPWHGAKCKLAGELAVKIVKLESIPCTEDILVVEHSTGELLKQKQLPLILIDPLPLLKVTTRNASSWPQSDNCKALLLSRQCMPPCVQFHATSKE